jgi:hypothetical protein
MKLVFDSIKRENKILYSYIWSRCPRIEKTMMRCSENSLFIFRVNNPTNIRIFSNEDNLQIVVSKDEKIVRINK